MISWDTRPDDAKPVHLLRDYTPTGEPRQVIARIEFTSEGSPVGYRQMQITPGWIAQHFPQLDNDARIAKFMELFNAVPETPQAVLDAVAAKIPAEAYKEIW